MGVSPSPFSKYCAGIYLLYDGVKTNNFKARTRLFAFNTVIFFVIGLLNSVSNWSGPKTGPCWCKTCRRARRPSGMPPRWQTSLTRRKSPTPELRL